MNRYTFIPSCPFKKGIDVQEGNKEVVKVVLIVDLCHIFSHDRKPTARG